MTDSGKKIWRSVILRSIGAVLLGGAVVSVSVVFLSLYGASPENIPVTTAQSQKSPALKFPENEQMLDSLSANLAHEGAALSNIEPAAGDKKSVPAEQNTAK